MSVQTVSDKDSSSHSTVGVSRRGFMVAAAGGALGLASATTSLGLEKQMSPANHGPLKCRYSFNTSCVRKAKLPLPELIDLVAKAGYQGIEPWINEIDSYVQSGGSLSDMRKRLDDLGLKVESAIGFPRWAVNDDKERAEGIEQAKREMDLLRQLGSTRIAAPPSGINRQDYDTIPLMTLAERYRTLLDVGVSMEVIPQLEIWGSSKNLSHIAEAAFVAVAANHPQAAILPDIYHLYRGGSDFDGLRLLSGPAINIFHMNDYPSDPPREQTRDSDRVYPGDGVAPLDLALNSLASVGFQGALSLELFNDEYYKQPPAEVITTGLRKMKDSVAAAGLA